MNRTAYIGIIALVLFLIVGIGVQFQTLSGVVTGEWARGFAAFVLLSGRFAFAMFAVDLFQRGRRIAGLLGIAASLVIAGMEAALIGLHEQRTDYRVFAWGIVSVSMLIEVMISVYVSGLEAESATEKAEAKPEPVVEKKPERKRRPTGKTDPEVAVKQAAKLPEVYHPETGKIIISKVAKEAGVSRPTARKYLNGSV